VYLSLTHRMSNSEEKRWRERERKIERDREVLKLEHPMLRGS